MAEKIGTFKVNGTKVELDLESIGSYIGNEPIKTYIDNHSGGTGGGATKIQLTFKDIDGEDFYNADAYSQIMFAYDNGGLQSVSDNFEVRILFEKEIDDSWTKAVITPTTIQIDDINRFVFFKCFIQTNSGTNYIYSYVLMSESGGLHTITKIGNNN